MKNNNGLLLMSCVMVAFGFIFVEAVCAESVHVMEKNMIIKGSFDTEITPVVDDELDVGRMLIKKTYSGDMNGTGLGQMLSFRVATKGSGAYVAIEHFTGAIGKLKGAFTLQHTGSMHRGVDSLLVVVVPDSGTGELVGIAGSLQINIVEGKHFYVFDYVLEPSQ